MHSLWYTIKYVFTLGGTIAAVGNEQLDFDSGQAILNDDRLLPALK